MIVEHAHGEWGATAAPGAAATLETGAVLWLPRLSFRIDDDERRIFSAALAGAAKNVSYTPATGRLGGSTARGDDAALLSRVLARFSAAVGALAASLCPEYGGRIEIARASFRPAEIAGRQTSWRKDDTRLHVDSFPSSPTGGRRILRVFTNVNPDARPRTWRIGGPFDAVVARFRHELRMPWPGQAAVLRALHVTRSRRTPYDALMLQLHDAMKRDETYQALPAHATIDFAAGTTWLAFTDAVPHAALRGQFQFEQTLLLPVPAMLDQTRSPLRILERAMNRPLS